MSCAVARQSWEGTNLIQSALNPGGNAKNS